MSVNSTLITAVGRLVTDVQTHVIATGVRVANFRVLCRERIHDRDKDEWRDGDRMYMNVACWRSLAENAAESLQEGDRVLIRGRLKVRDYVDKDGQRRSAVDVDASSVGAELSLNTVAINRRDWGTSPHQQSLLDPPPTDADSSVEEVTKAA